MGVFELPEGYSEIKRVNLQKDKKLAIFINVGALIIMIALFIIGNIIAPFHFETFMEPKNLLTLMAILFVVLLAIIAYMVTHELVHGIFFKKYSGKKAKYGFTGLYAYAGSEAYFSKRQYLIIGLAPVVLLGLIILLFNILFPEKWFWAIYVIQIVNLSGAAGDIYMAWLMSRLNEDVLIKDEGISMSIYSRIL